MTSSPNRPVRTRRCASLLALVATLSSSACLMPATVRMSADPELDVPVLLGPVTRLGGGSDVPGESPAAVVLSRQFPGVVEARMTVDGRDPGGAPVGWDLIRLRRARVHGSSFLLFQGTADIGIELHGDAWPRREVRR